MVTSIVIGIWLCNVVTSIVIGIWLYNVVTSIVIGIWLCNVVISIVIGIWLCNVVTSIMNGYVAADEEVETSKRSACFCFVLFSFIVIHYFIIL